jgi:hypothetical protein
MSSSISASQKENIDFIKQLNEAPDGEVVQDALVTSANYFLDVLAKKVNQYKLVNTGDLLKKAKIEEIGTNQVNVKLPYYYDFINKGVRGAKSKQPASSPYSFKDSFSMSPEGRKNIKSLIDNGKAKLRVVQPGREVGLERKRRSVADIQLDTLIFRIKSYGIKRRPYFDEALKESKQKIIDIVGEAYGKEITLSIKPK